MLVLLATYILLGISRLLTDYYDNVILPKSADVTSKGSAVVLKEDHLKLKEVNKQLESRLDEERLAKVSAQNERDASDKRLYAILNPEVGKYAGNESPYKEIKEKYEQIGQTEDIDAVINRIQSAKLISNEMKAIKAFLRDGFIEVKSQNSSQPNHAIYTFTGEGREFIRYYNNRIATHS
ncbi:hypothetical protein [Pedobacter namyangjuensis]|uniref:hypothetical protein n=1 Tax=Pedobacter namyangjuensis TaxID=600626 RepID=UPI0013B36E93|nr:hypothetical protein [Pedobacter namyangjuensis]